MAEYLGLPAFCGALDRIASGEKGSGVPAPNYRKVWLLTASGKIPAELANNRYRIRAADVEAIAASLGLIRDAS
jgi:hypothetical protein